MEQAAAALHVENATDGADHGLCTTYPYTSRQILGIWCFGEEGIAHFKLSRQARESGIRTFTPTHQVGRVTANTRLPLKIVITLKGTYKMRRKGTP